MPVEYEYKIKRYQKILGSSGLDTSCMKDTGGVKTPSGLANVFMRLDDLSIKLDEANEGKSGLSTNLQSSSEHHVKEKHCK